MLPLSDLSCNGGRGFNCGDSNCVTWSEYCDNVINCETENDEEDCLPKTCVDWWNAGYRNKRTDKIREQFMQISVYLCIVKYHKSSW